MKFRQGNLPEQKTRGKEFVSVARLRKRSLSESESCADSRQVGMKVPKSQGQDPRPVDLALGRVKSRET